MKARAERARRPVRDAAARRALWALAVAIEERPGWDLTYVTLEGKWTIAAWRVRCSVSLFFDDDHPKGPGTAFGVGVSPLVPTARWRAKLSRSAWYRGLLAHLGEGYRGLPPKVDRKDRPALKTFVLRTGDVRKVAGELDRLAKMIGGVTTRTTLPTGRRRPTVFSLCESIARSAGPWRLHSVSYSRKSKTRRHGTSWKVWKSLGASTLYATKSLHGPGLLSMLGVDPSDWTPETRLGWRPPLPNTERELLRAGYEAHHGAEDRAATFIRISKGISIRSAFRELERLERLGLA